MFLLTAFSGTNIHMLGLGKLPAVRPDREAETRYAL